MLNEERGRKRSLGRDFSPCHGGSWGQKRASKMERCMSDYPHFMSSDETRRGEEMKLSFNIGFHIVRHSNEDNIGSKIALHHHDVANKSEKIVFR